LFSMNLFKIKNKRMTRESLFLTLNMIYLSQGEYFYEK